MLKNGTLLLSLVATLATTRTSDSCQLYNHYDCVSDAESKATFKEKFNQDGECHMLSKDSTCDTSEGEHWKSPYCEKTHSPQKLQSKEQLTSVWCQTSSKSGLRCHFRNLWYNAVYKEFVFIVGSESIISGIGSLKDLEELYLSSVNGHNVFQIKLSVVPWKADIENNSVITIKGRTLILGRFKPDNILHVFHDDLLPLYFTLKELCPDMKVCWGSFNVVFTDENERNEFWDLYALFSSKLWMLSDFIPVDSEWYCFERAYLGLNKMSVWYQYGFGVPQGPLVSKHFLGSHLRLFTNYVRDQLGVKRTSERQNAILLSRKLNRRIWNEKELVDAIQSLFSSQKESKGIKVKIMSLEEHDLKSLITELSKAVLVVGVHGSALSLGMFLPPGSVLVEIWPYGVDPSVATVFKTMCELQGFDVVYVPWVNEDISNTIYHTEYPAYYGGLDHLSQTERKDILGRFYKDKLSELECCDSIEWLFRVYQDTRVHIYHDVKYRSVSILDSITEALARLKFIKFSQSDNVLEDLKGHTYPGKVQFLNCRLDRQKTVTKLYAEWQEPWNVKHLNCVDLKYEVILQKERKGDFVSHEVQEHKFLKKLNIDVESLDMWVTSFCDGVEGSASYIACQ